MRILGPLGSVQARGQFAGRLIFQEGPYGPKCYFKFPTRYTRTPAQKVTRQDYSICVAEWRIVPESDWLKWSSEANAFGITGLNLFMKWFICYLNNAISGVAEAGGTMSGAVRPDIETNPYKMEHIGSKIY